MNRVDFLYKIASLLTKAKDLSIPLICFTFYRSQSEQDKMVEEGKSFTRHGKHTKWLAMDFVIYENGKCIWENDFRYNILGVYWESLGGTWGGRWNNLNDIYHFEV